MSTLTTAELRTLLTGVWKASYTYGDENSHSIHEHDQDTVSYIHIFASQATATSSQNSHTSSTTNSSASVQVSTGGTDEAGAFNITGRVWSEGSTCLFEFTKSYSEHAWAQWGVVNGKHGVMEGYWGTERGEVQGAAKYVRLSWQDVSAEEEAKEKQNEQQDESVQSSLRAPAPGMYGIYRYL